MDGKTLTSHEEIFGYPGYVADVELAKDGSNRIDVAIADYRIQGEMIPCSISNCHQPHRKGYLVKTSQGQVINIGHFCGKNHFEKDYEAVKREINDRNERRKNRDLVQELIEILNNSWQDTQEMIACAKLLGRITRSIRSASITVSDILREMARQNRGSIVRKADIDEDRSTGFFAYKTYRKRRMSDALPSENIEVLGTLEGVSFIIFQFKEVLIDKVHTPALELLALSPEDVSQLSKSELKKFSKLKADLPSTLEKARKAINEGRKFLTPENLETLKLLKNAGVDSAEVDRVLSAIHREISTGRC